MTSHRDPTRRFSDRVDAYVAARPGYPVEVATELARVLELPAGATVVDIGSGTGLSCVPFLQAGFRVIGVEPDAAMRAAGDAFLADRPAFRSVSGRAEATGLDDASIDLVVAAQAAHWFDALAARAELARILRPPRPIALIWNDRPATGSAFAEGYEAVLRAFGEGYEDVRRRHGEETVVALLGAPPARTLELPNDSLLDRPTLLARVESASYMPRAGSPGYEPMVAALDELFRATAQDGLVRMPLTTRVYLGFLSGAD